LHQLLECNYRIYQILTIGGYNGYGLGREYLMATINNARQTKEKPPEGGFGVSWRPGVESNH
jgi:hypothetical protein